MKRLAMVTLAFGLLRCWSWLTFLENAASEVTAALFTVPMHTLAEIFVGSWTLFTIPAAWFVVGRPKSGRWAWTAIGCLLTASMVLLAPLPHGERADAAAAVAAGVGRAR